MRTIISAICILTITFLLPGCYLDDDIIINPDDCINLMGIITTEERNVSDFDQISVKGIAKINLLQGSSQLIKIEADEGLLPFINTSVVNGKLNIGYDECFDSNEGVEAHTPEFTITIPDLSSLQFEGVGEVCATDQFRGEDLNLELEGVVAVKLDIEYSRLKASFEGLSTAELKGKVREQRLNLEGLSIYRAKDLSSKRCFAEINGGGTAEVRVSDLLDVMINGIGNLCYEGQPEINSDISPAGILRNCN
jgi:hypothetical protein